MWDWLMGRNETPDPRMEAALRQQVQVDDVSSHIDRIYETEARLIREARGRGAREEQP